MPVGTEAEGGRGIGWAQLETQSRTYNPSYPVLDTQRGGCGSHARHGGGSDDAKVPVTYAIIGSGSTAFAIFSLAIAKLVPDNAYLRQLHIQRMPVRAAQFAVVGFITSIASQLLNAMFEDSRLKFQHNLLVIYVNSIAALTSLIICTSNGPVIMDSFGVSFNPLRWLSWLLTTPVMVYTLSLMSAFSWQRTTFAIVLDLLMLLFGAAAQVPNDKTFSWMLFLIGGLAYVALVQQMWQMFDSAMDFSWASKRNLELKATRALTIMTWCTFPLVWALRATDSIDEATSEALYELGNFVGKSTFATTLMHDNFMSINERRSQAMKAAEEANRATLLEELRELVAQKDSLLSSTSHELKTPLTGIIGLSESILNGNAGPVNDRVQKQISTVLSSARRLLSLIQNMLDAAAIKRKSVNLNLTHVDVETVVGHVVELTRPLLHVNVQLKHSIQQGLPKLLADEGRLTQILHNLLANAAKFTTVGYVAISVRLAEKSMEFVVADSGPGIPKEKQQQIFLPFQQLDPSVTRKHGGTGLGLNLVQQLVHAHNGTINLQSDINQGAKFIILLPLDAGNNQSDQHMSHRRSVIGESEIKHEETPSCGEAPRFERQTVCTRSTMHDSGATKAPTAADHARNEAVPNHKTGAMDLEQVKQHGIHSKQDVQQFSCGSLRTAESGESANECLHDGNQSHSICCDPSEFFTHADVFGNIQVLSIDDDPVNQMVIDSLLGSKGYEVTCALNAQEAMKCLEENAVPPDCVLLDVMMPEVSGIELCATLRDRYSTTRVPILMISAKSQEDTVLESFRNGANEFLTKPFKGEELAARIEAQIHLRKQWKLETKSLASNMESKTARAISGKEDAEQQPVETAESPSLERTDKSMRRSSNEEQSSELKLGRSLSHDVHIQQPLAQQSLKMHGELAICVADIVEWQQLLCSISASSSVNIMKQVIASLNHLHEIFNSTNHCEAQGDFILLVNFEGDASALAEFAEQFMTSIEELEPGEEARHAGYQRLHGRVGLDVGQCFADAIGHRPKWWVYGDAVANALALKANALVGTVHCSDQVAARLKAQGHYVETRYNSDLNKIVIPTKANDGGEHAYRHSDGVPFVGPLHQSQSREKECSGAAVYVSRKVASGSAASGFQQ